MCFYFGYFFTLRNKVQNPINIAGSFAFQGIYVCLHIETHTCHRFGTSSAVKDTEIPPQFPGCFLPPKVQDVQIFGVQAWSLDRQQNDSVVSLKEAQEVTSKMSIFNYIFGYDSHTCCI